MTTFKPGDKIVWQRGKQRNIRCVIEEIYGENNCLMIVNMNPGRTPQRALVRVENCHKETDYNALCKQHRMQGKQKQRDRFIEYRAAQLKAHYGVFLLQWRSGLREKELSKYGTLYINGAKRRGLITETGLGITCEEAAARGMKCP
jgi:hypothetical protein